MEDMHELTAEQQAELLRHELEAVYGSSSYKIGRAVTWLPRHAARGLKYLLHNGPAVSVRYIVTYLKYRKIANKNYAYWACLQKKDYPEALKSGSWRPITPTRRWTWNTPKRSAKRPSGSNSTAALRTFIRWWTSIPCGRGSRRRSARNT